MEPSELGVPEDQSMSTALVSRKGYAASGQHGNGSYGEADDTQIARRDSYAMQHIPPSLVPGLDPVLAREVSDRIYEERRNERRQRAQSAATPPRGREWAEAPPRDYANGGSPIPPSPLQQQYQQAYEARSSFSYSNRGTPTGGRGISKSPSRSPIPSRSPVPSRSPLPSPQPSPNPSHTIKRKSVSPAPPPAERRSATDAPYGPDSYDVLNPTLSASQTDLELPDPDAKIITYDGKEIDPSDHLPMESWAPEPEPRDKARSNSGESGRERPRGAQPPPPTGRRQLRIAGRPQSVAGPAPHPDDHPHTPPVSAGRNRLQRKANRTSAMPSGTSAGPSPLAPISSHSYNADGGFAPPRPTRASTWDYPSENHSPGGGARGAPAPPPKVPVPSMSGALVAAGGGGTEDWALMEEMRRIDIGAGRSRRHGGY